MNMPVRPVSDSCDQNREPIIAILAQEFSGCSDILEIGSGTGQHAVYFAPELSHARWQPSDVAEHLPGIVAWIDAMPADNILAPVELDVRHSRWPDTTYDGTFSANTVHIMGWGAVCDMFAGIGRVLEPGGRFCLYGPFNYGGEYTSESNARFDIWLKDRNPESSIKDFEAVVQLADDHGMTLLRDHEMPANNRILVWEKAPA